MAKISSTSTVTMAALLICLFGTSMITLSAGFSSDFSYSRVFYITPNNTNETAATTSDPLRPDEQQLGSAMDGILPSGTTNYTLQEVLQNYKQFFTSNTKLQLLPGIHEVSESFGALIVQDIHNFAIVGHVYDDGATSNGCLESDNGTLQLCSKIECTGNAARFGLAFMNSTNLNISKIHFKDCGGNIRETEPYFKKFHGRKYRHNMEYLYENIFHCKQFTVLTAYSRDISFNQVYQEDSVGVSGCFATVGVHSLTIRYSMFETRLIVTITHSPQTAVSYTTETQHFTLRLTNLTFMANKDYYSNETRGLDMYLAKLRELDSVDIFVENVTSKHRHLLFSNSNSPFNSVVITINSVVLIGNEQECFGMIFTMQDSNYRGQDTKGITGNRKVQLPEMNTKIVLENAQFFQSSIIMSECPVWECYAVMIQGNFVTMDIEMSNVLIQNVPCKCRAALSVDFAHMSINYLRIIDSCSKGEALAVFFASNVSFAGFNDFLRNNGTSIASIHGWLNFEEDALFRDNIANQFSGSTIVLVNTTCEILAYESFVLENNTGASCGGILAKERSRLEVYTPVEFTNNKGFDGGALALYEQSIFTSNIDAVCEFTGNSARNKGGAIYIEDDGYIQTFDAAGRTFLCAIWSFNYDDLLDVTNVFTTSQLLLINNTAVYSGSSIYGGWIDICISPTLTIEQHFIHTELPYRDYGKRLPTNQIGLEDPSIIASNPSRLCICMNSTANCAVTDYNISSIYPGQSFQIEVVAVGQRMGTAPAIVLAAFVNASTKVNELQQLQNVKKICSQLNYTIKSPNKNERLQLTVDRTNIPSAPDFEMFPNIDLSPFQINTHQMSVLEKQLSLSIHLLPCPLGYEFERNLSSCVCKRELEKRGIECNTTTYTIHRTSRQWINATFTHILNETNHGVLVHNHCPLDYCLDEDQFLNLEKPSNQCNFERSGILCGSCQQNLSHIFGSNKCKKCSSLWAILVIPVFILLGLGLVALIILLNLTVAEGTVNALIFYVNIVSANQATFFPIETTNTFFRWFIAWLNLDIGVETCFISGLGAYTKTWLQFLFPFYIWFLVIVIIMASRRSTLAARLSGENAVQALGTLFLLSYTKLLRITITTFSSAQLVYPDGFTRRVWLYDGNVEFLEAKHAVLFVAALLLLVLISAPYTLVLLTIQWLQRLPYHFLLSWVWKLKPLFDAHTGPHKEKHRYWPGLLLLIRAILFVAFSLNFRNDPALNLLITSITSFCLLTYLAYLGGVYQAIYLDILEYVFLLNLGILSAATFYTRLTEGDQDKVIKTSVSIALFVSLVIVLSHVYLKVKSTRHGSHFLHFLSETFKKACSPLTHALNRFGIVKTITRNNPFIDNTGTAARAKKTHTHSTIELKEPLLVEAKMA